MNDGLRADLPKDLLRSVLAHVHLVKLHRGSDPRAAVDSHDLVAIRNEVGDELARDDAGGAGNQDFHDSPLVTPPAACSAGASPRRRRLPAESSSAILCFTCST